jgi:ATP-dependent DNA helicase RecQ
VIVKKILSGVARMSRKNGTLWEGKFGRGKIVQMLVGGKSQEVLGAGLNKLSTYGILKNLGSGQVNGVMRSLADAGLLRTEAGEFPVVTLTEKGDKVMLGKSSYSLIWPKEKVLEIAELKDAGFDPVLFGALRDLRARLAKAENVPAYCVFGNKTIEALARYRPRTIDEMLLVPGVGAVKVQRYARPFLDTIKDWPTPL